MRVNKSLISISGKKRELLLYGIFGLGATITNIFVFIICRNVIRLELIPSNVIAWTVAFIFAFVSNKLWVFESKAWTGDTAVKEMLSFFMARIGTLFLDMLLMWMMIDALRWNDLFSKLITNATVIVMNYILSKMWVFKQKQDE